MQTPAVLEATATILIVLSELSPPERSSVLASLAKLEPAEVPLARSAEDARPASRAAARSQGRRRATNHSEIPDLARAAGADGIDAELVAERLGVSRGAAAKALRRRWAAGELRRLAHGRYGA